MKKPGRYHGECCASGGAAAKTLAACGPSGFGLGTSLGTTFTMIPPRLFQIMFHRHIYPKVYVNMFRVKERENMGLIFFTVLIQKSENQRKVFRGCLKNLSLWSSDFPSGLRPSGKIFKIFWDFKIF